MVRGILICPQPYEHGREEINHYPGTRGYRALVERACLAVEFYQIEGNNVFPRTREHKLWWRRIRGECVKLHA